MTLQDKVGKAIIQLRKERNISLDILERVCQQLGIKISEFFVVVESIKE